MILRLVFSFFFFSLVTGNQRLEEPKKAERTGPCENNVCLCQEQLKLKSGNIPSASPSITTHHQGSLRLPLRVDQSHYGLPPNSLTGATHISSNPASRIETKSYDVEFVSDNENPSSQVPIPVQYVDEETQYVDKTICFTPRMVHRMVKAALEYVSQIPSDTNNIIDYINQELNRFSDQDSIEDHYVQKPPHPLDSKSIFQMVNKPKSETRTNFVLKYELPGTQEPQCRDALEKLIEIAYNAYRELEKHPQCKDYLYRFASQHTDDRPTGHLEHGPDINSLIASILEKVDQHKSKPRPEYNRPDIFNINTSDIDIPDIEFPQSPEIQIKEYNIPNIHEIHIPQIHEYNIPQSNEYTIKKIHEYNIPQSDEYTIKNIHEYNIPQSDEYHVKTITQYNIPQSNEYNIPKIPHYNIPKSDEYTIKKIHEYNIPHIKEITFKHKPQVHVQEIDIPETGETIEETIIMQPEETIHNLVKLLENNDQPNDDLFDRFMDILADNPNNFHPQVHNILTTILNANKHKNIPKVNDILLLLLDSERNKKPWGEKITEHILSYLTPDTNGNLDSRLVDIILNLYRKPANQKHIEYILSLLKHIKEGNLDSKIADIILNLINANQNHFLLPENIDILLKLLKPSHNGAVNTKEVEIIDELSRWNEIGFHPNHLDAVLTLLKPDLYGRTDHRIIDIIHFLLTKIKHLNPNNLNFILKFLYPENGFLDLRRIEVIHFLLNSGLPSKHMNILLSMLQENPHGVLNSSFLNILMFLGNNRLLTPKMLEILVAIISDDVMERLDDDQVKGFFFQLAPLKQTYPTVIGDIINILNQRGLNANLLEWLAASNNNADMPNRDASPFQIKKEPLIEYDHDNQYRIPDGGYQTQDDFMTIFKWLDSQGLLNPNQGASNNDLINKMFKVLEMGERESGAVELTYMLKHEKPLVYQPVYYVKYRLPILSFISNMKTLITENPQLTADPMKLLQELIVVSNVTEVSPNLQGFPKDEILKLTFNEGDLVQAKILDEQNLNLNEQITYVHGLNADISPEEILQLNKMNEAKYYPPALTFRETYPESKVTVHEVEKIVELPTVHYQQFEQLIPHHYHPVQIVERMNEHVNPDEHNNAQLQSSN